MQLNKLVFFIFAVLLTASANATNIKVRFLNGIQNYTNILYDTLELQLQKNKKIFCSRTEYFFINRSDYALSELER